MSVLVRVMPNDGRAVSVRYSRVPCIGETVQLKDQGFEYRVISVRQMPFADGEVNAIIYVECIDK